MSSGAVEKPAAFVVRIRKLSVIIQLSTTLQGGAVQNTAM
jgi:hypothetical protein